MLPTYICLNNVTLQHWKYHWKLVRKHQWERLTFSFSWASFTVLPSFFFLQLCPSFLKYLSTFLSKRKSEPPRRAQDFCQFTEDKKNSTKLLSKRNTQIFFISYTGQSKHIMCRSIQDIIKSKVGYNSLFNIVVVSYSQPKEHFCNQNWSKSAENITGRSVGRLWRNMKLLMVPKNLTDLSRPQPPVLCFW